LAGFLPNTLPVHAATSKVMPERQDGPGGKRSGFALCCANRNTRTARTPQDLVMSLTYPALANNERIRKAAQNAPALKAGEQGLAVAILQGALVDLGYAMPRSMRSGKPDGVFGGETTDAVRAFQSDNGLGADGAAGRQTLARLDQLLSAAHPVPKSVPKPSPVSVPTSSRHRRGTGDPPVTRDVGAGPWRSKPETMTSVVLKQAIVEQLNATHFLIGEDATLHLNRFFQNTGTPYTMDLEGMIREAPDATKRFKTELQHTRRFVESLPVGSHWFTSRSVEYGWSKGRATVRSGARGREYQVDFEFKVFDRYNWDGGKGVDIPIFDITEIEVTDDFMAEFHRQGLAKEFDLSGTVRRNLRWRHGYPIPSHQVLP
jgi:peptidoglycan hydrolase-like protein with peptidoglycan-binding domain